MPSATAELLALLAPPACVACRGPVASAGALVCPGCLRALPWLPRDCCPRCALHTHAGRSCRATRASFDGAAAVVAHEGSGRDLVHALKFRAALPLAPLLAAQMVHRAGLLGVPAAGAGRGGLALVPVPATPAGKRRRGFDQAERLAVALGSRIDRPVLRCLRRRGGARQVGAGRRERLEAQRVDVFVVSRAPERALLIDDVHTTGATLEACARALKDAGATQVLALTYARAL